jgi:hypothetical protein
MGRETASDFYRLAGEFLRAWIAAERGLLGVTGMDRIAVPSRVEPPEACDGCLAKA